MGVRQTPAILWKGTRSMGNVLISVLSVVLIGSAALACGSAAISQRGPLELVPDDASYVGVWDVKAVLSREAPDRLEDTLEDNYEDMLEDVGIDLADLDTLVAVHSEEGSLVIVDGNFDLEIVMEELDDRDYDDRKYQGYEIWEPDSNRWWPFAFIGNSGPVMAGDSDAVKRVLKGLKRDSKFLFDDKESGIVRAFNKAGQGWIVSARDHCGYYGASNVSGCEAAGQAVSRGEEEYIVGQKAVYLFRSERKAESEMDDLEEVVEDDLPRRQDIDEVTQDGVFVVISMSIDEDDYDDNR